MLPINARPRVTHCHVHAVCLALLGADHQRPWPLFEGAHCFDRIQNQVQDDLLQLNTISLNGKRPLHKVGIYRNSILGDCASRQSNHLIDGLTEIKANLLRSLFLDVITDPVDDLSGSIGIAQDAVEGFSNLTQIRRLLDQKIQGRTGVVARAGARLRDFVN
jgi:hypothetical protein